MSSKLNRKQRRLSNNKISSMMRVKPQSAFKSKMQKFRQYVLEKTGEENINSLEIESKDREKIRKEAKEFANLN